MNLEDKRRAYQAFFMKNEAGKEFVQFIASLINSGHVSAENDPDHARDYVQRSKGARQVLDHIASVTAEPKKGGAPKE